LLPWIQRLLCTMLQLLKLLGTQQGQQTQNPLSPKHREAAGILAIWTGESCLLWSKKGY
jgi:hypothetical protein